MGHSQRDERIGVALSGGGHRASCWAAGAMLGLVDAGVGGAVVSVASVSGGSITNGLLAAGGDRPWPTDRAALVDVLGPGLRAWSAGGLFFPGPPTARWVTRTLGLFGVALSALLAALAVTVAAVAGADGWWPAPLAAAVVALVAVGVAVVKLPLTTAQGLVLVASTATVGTTALASALWGPGWAAAGAWVLAVVLLVIALRAFAGRGSAVVAGLAGTLYRPAGAGRAPVRMADLGRGPVHHVLCATDLDSGDSLYLSNRLTWSHGGPYAPAGRLPLAEAVHASACLPGGFLARRIGLGGDVTRLVSDGGVYDNMADQWEWGLGNRRSYADAGARALLDDAQPEGATHHVVVNASRGMDRRRARTIGPGLLGEVRSTLAAKDVLYDVSTAVRRRLLVERFDTARESDADTGHGLLVHIGTSPYTVVDRFAGAGGAVATRAVAARAFLDRLTDQELATGAGDAAARRRWWRARADANSSVPTTLGPLDRAAPHASAHLVHHAWVQTRLTGHVLFGWGELPGATDDIAPWTTAAFVTLVEGGA